MLYFSNSYIIFKFLVYGPRDLYSFYLPSSRPNFCSVHTKKVLQNRNILYCSLIHFKINHVTITFIIVNPLKPAHFTKFCVTKCAYEPEEFWREFLFHIMNCCSARRHISLVLWQYLVCSPNLCHTLCDHWTLSLVCYHTSSSSCTKQYCHLQNLWFRYLSKNTLCPFLFHCLLLPVSTIPTDLKQWNNRSIFNESHPRVSGTRVEMFQCFRLY